MGYHVRTIKKGSYGDSSKIVEEVEELIDSENQNCKVMILNELSDIIGAIDGYLIKHYSTITLDDLITMARITKRVFEGGTRK